MACMDFNEFTRWILQFDQKAAIDKNKDKPLRYDVWKTTSAEISAITDSLSISALPDSSQSLRIGTKVKNALKRVKENNKTGGTIQEDIFNHKFNKEMSIALHELMESVKGEADKARNNGIEVSSISDTGVLPALPLSRVAASIGRKIAFQKGYRFKRATKADDSKDIEALYYDIGREALVQLEKAGYVKSHENISTIMDYLNKEDLKKDFPKNDKTRNDVLSVSLDEKKLGIKPNTPTSTYFLNRSDSNLDNTDLGVVTEKLRAANMLLQPATVVFPDDTASLSDEELKQWDEGVENLDPITEKVRKQIYEKPVRVNKVLSGFLELLQEEQKNTGKSASKRLNEIFGNRKNMIRSLFGLKRSDDFSIDKKESVGGQNLSKTTPLDDLVEYYDLLKGDLHTPMKVGRNARLYYLNSVLNAHGSKQSRYMLTPGEYTVDTGSADFDYLVYQISESLKVEEPNGEVRQYTYEDIVSGTGINEALEANRQFVEGKSLRAKTQALGALAHLFPGIDYVTITTALTAAQDVRSPSKGKVTTEFTVSADATASGGTLTFLQALGTNARVEELLQRIGVLNEDSLVQKDLDDIYGLMTNAVQDFLAGKPGSGLGADLGESDVTGILQDTLDMLFIKNSVNPRKKQREFSKDPTMTFIYGQGKTSGADTLARTLADRVIDNLDDKETRNYLVALFDDKTFKKANAKELKDEKGLYDKVVDKLKDTGLPSTLFELMETNVKEEYLAEYTQRSKDVYAFVKELPSDTPFKILPAGARLAKIPVTFDNLQTYGMPITKTVEVLNKFKGIADTVLTRREKLMKTVMDVSTTHGQDAALLYHALNKVDPDNGVVVIHDDVRGDVKTIRAMEKAYADTAVEMAKSYDVHQQIMEAVAAYSPEIAASSEFRTLQDKINETVAEKKRIISANFNENTTALIGDGDAFQKFADPGPVDTEAGTTVQSTIPIGSPLTEQDFGDATLTITEGDETVEVLAQEYWNDINSRLKMVESLRTCLAN